jgi:hypothetical protein
MAAWKAGTNIQLAMPKLSEDERYFITTGVTPDEWASILGAVE